MIRRIKQAWANFYYRMVVNSQVLEIAIKVRFWRIQRRVVMLMWNRIVNPIYVYYCDTIDEMIERGHAGVSDFDFDNRYPPLYMVYSDDDRDGWHVR